jgi:hypothetical protein
MNLGFDFCVRPPDDKNKSAAPSPDLDGWMPQSPLVLDILPNNASNSPVDNAFRRSNASLLRKALPFGHSGTVEFNDRVLRVQVMSQFKISAILACDKLYLMQGVQGKDYFLVDVTAYVGNCRILHMSVGFHIYTLTRTRQMSTASLSPAALRA